MCAVCSAFLAWERLSENENIGLLEAKVPYFDMESTEVYVKEVRCFCISGGGSEWKLPGMAVQGVVLRLCLSLSITCRQPSSRKKVLKKILHFLHPSGKLPLYALLFRCRMGCSMASTGCRIGEGFWGKGVFFVCCFLHFLHAESLRMWNGMSGTCKIIWCLSFRAGLL